MAWQVLAAIALSGFVLDQMSAAEKRRAGYAQAEAQRIKREKEAIEILRDVGKLTGKQAAQYLKSGVDIHVGTPFEVISRSARDAIADADMVRQYGFDEANRMRGIADAEKRAGEFSAFGNLIRSGATAYAGNQQGLIASGEATEGTWSAAKGISPEQAAVRGMPYSDGLSMDYMMSRYGR